MDSAVIERATAGADAPKAPGACPHSEGGEPGHGALRDAWQEILQGGSLSAEDAAYIAPSVFEAFGRVLSVGKEPGQAAFIARSLNAVARVASRLSEAQLGDAAGAPSDVAVLVKALRAPEAIADLEEDPLAGARLRGAQVRLELLTAEGGTLGVEQVAELLGLSRQAVDKRRRAGTLLAVEVGKRGYRYPAWQFSGGEALPGLPGVLRALDVSPWTQLSWFLSADLRLGGERPLDLLRRRDPEQVKRVVRAAAAYGHQGAA
ncbi:MAG: hypothetical protein AVDCRST_MAG77-3650 [uncultured Chloroflexi bacterium]|uniref:Antitoxin Xre/MbcA/ParS-like toxin-binding domain-containing protein n=1 Tax=uncultured Chloroflexota bacterium TaxID=166587 RepID=A0A6J4JJU8_9CHLR|nr:MAG: hypothetical protein AVDCRST_MAG77-3650 [uncultured Chloroflexota bacterium]